jgi:hypothetical protein
LRPPGVAVGRTEPEPFGDTRAQAFDQDVGRFDELKDGLNTARILQINRNRWTATSQDVFIGRTELESVATRTVDTDDIGAQIGEQHRGERARADADELDDAYAVKGS